MDRTAQAQILQQIHMRREILAERWYRTLAPNSFTPLSPAAVSQQLAELVGQLATVWLSEPFDPAPAYAAGVTLAGLRVAQPDSLRRTFPMLAELLAGGIDAATAVVLQPRLVALLAEVTAGMLERAPAMPRPDQESLWDPLIAARVGAGAADDATDELYRQIAEHIHEVFWLFDVELNRVIYVSPAYEAIWGERVERVYDQRFSFLAAVHPDDHERVRRALEHVADGEYDVEYRIVRPDGGMRWIRDRAFPIRRAGGKVWRAAGIAEDITAAKLAEQALRESEERQRRLSEATFEAIVVHEQGIILDVNDNVGRMFGYESAEMIGRSILDFVAPERRERAIARIGQHGDEPAESIGLRKDGTRFPFEVRARSIPYAGRTVRVLAVRDLTERRRAEAERLAIEHQMLEHQRFESLGLLARGIAHEFNNLLGIILGYASLARLGLPTDSALLEPIDAIVTTARQGATLPRQMLAYAGKGPTVLQRADLNDLVRETSALVSASVSKNVTVHYRLAPALPFVEVDPGQLRQVVMNLVINAAEAVAEQAGEIHITTAVRQVTHGDVSTPVGVVNLHDGDYVCLSVADTGAGMDVATRKRIFEPFFSTKLAGRGLGLAAVAGIVRRHGGAVTVESEPGRGTSFTVILRAADDVRATAVAQEAPSSDGAGGSVLVVDDNAGVQQVAATMLRRQGLDVQLAGDGRAALERLREHAGRIRCVVLDMTMPGMSGEATLVAIRDFDPGLPVILMSGHSRESVAGQLGGLGAPLFLQKPFTASELRDAVAQALAQGEQPPG